MNCRLIKQLLIALSVGLLAPRAIADELSGFVTRTGDQLLEAGKPFRFISVNIPNLQLIEDNFAPDAKTAWAWPNEFELNDALESVRQMGGTVVRTYVLSVRRKGTDMGDFVYVRGPGDFNEEAFRSLDLAIDVAHRKGVRLVIPLVDNWKWQGGRGEYAAFRGKQPDDFWTDEQVIGDFEQTVRHLLTRVNSRTGIAYRDEPAILGWETGNELDCPPQWTRRIAALMKSLDPKHLVLDGRSLHGVPAESLDDPNIDVITTHHYPNTDDDYVRPILAAREKTRGKKAYVVGEFGFTGADKIEKVYDAVIQSGASGALLWSLRFHDRDGGFYWHFEPAGGHRYKAYHWPGFDSGHTYDERRVMQLTRAKAYQIRELPPPARTAPAAPTLLPISDPSAISWQGSAGASGYFVERSESKDGPWQRIADNAHDDEVQYRPLLNDETAEPGRTYFYRIAAQNDVGASTPSPPVGPVHVDHRTLVDECRDLSKVHAAADGVKPTTGDDRRRREDVSRLLIPANKSVVYQTSTPIRSWKALEFCLEPGAKLDVELSADGTTFTPAIAEGAKLPAGSRDYDYLPQLTLHGGPANATLLRLTAVGGSVELSLVEACY
jgi:hypothetical protein